jgi:hypothetical protein
VVCQGRNLLSVMRSSSLRMELLLRPCKVVIRHNHVIVSAILLLCGVPDGKDTGPISMLIGIASNRGVRFNVDNFST